MNQQELSTNIQILEYLGWFVAEDETDEDSAQFDVLLKCCKPDGTPIEEVPVTDFLLSFYDEEDGSLEGRLWFFAPKYATSMDNMRTLLDEPHTAFEWEIEKSIYFSDEEYCAEVTALGWDEDGDCYESSWGRAYDKIHPAMALAIAYLKCKGVIDE